MNEPAYTESRIFRHMTPSTIAAWVSDLDDANILADLDATDLALMESAIMELFALVGLEALAMLDTYGIDAAHPLVMAAVEEWNEALP